MPWLLQEEKPSVPSLSVALRRLKPPMAEGKPAAFSTAAVLGPSSDSPALFVDTSLGSSLVMLVSPAETIGEFKRRFLADHIACYPNMGEISIRFMKVRRNESSYHITDAVPFRKAFERIKGCWYLHVDATVNGAFQDQPAATADTTMTLNRGHNENIMLQNEPDLTRGKTVSEGQKKKQTGTKELEGTCEISLIESGKGNTSIAAEKCITESNIDLVKNHQTGHEVKDDVRKYRSGRDFGETFENHVGDPYIVKGNPRKRNVNEESNFEGESISTAKKRRKKEKAVEECIDRIVRSAEAMSNVCMPDSGKLLNEEKSKNLCEVAALGSSVDLSVDQHGGGASSGNFRKVKKERKKSQKYVQESEITAEENGGTPVPPNLPEATVAVPSTTITEMVVDVSAHDKKKKLRHMKDSTILRSEASDLSPNKTVNALDAEKNQTDEISKEPLMTTIKGPGQKPVKCIYNEGNTKIACDKNPLGQDPAVPADAGKKSLRQRKSTKSKPSKHDEDTCNTLYSSDKTPTEQCSEDCSKNTVKNKNIDMMETNEEATTFNISSGIMEGEPQASENLNIRRSRHRKRDSKKNQLFDHHPTNSENLLSLQKQLIDECPKAGTTNRDKDNEEVTLQEVADPSGIPEVILEGHLTNGDRQTRRSRKKLAKIGHPPSNNDAIHSSAEYTINETSGTIPIETDKPFNLATSHYEVVAPDNPAEMDIATHSDKNGRKRLSRKTSEKPKNHSLGATGLEALDLSGEEIPKDKSATTEAVAKNGQANDKNDFDVSSSQERDGNIKNPANLDNPLSSVAENKCLNDGKKQLADIEQSENNNIDDCSDNKEEKEDKVDSHIEIPKSNAETVNFKESFLPQSRQNELAASVDELNAEAETYKAAEKKPKSRSRLAKSNVPSKDSSLESVDHLGRNRRGKKSHLCESGGDSHKVPDAQDVQLGEFHHEKADKTLEKSSIHADNVLFHAIQHAGSNTSQSSLPRNSCDDKPDQTSGKSTMPTDHKFYTLGSPNISLDNEQDDTVRGRKGKQTHKVVAAVASNDTTEDSSPNKTERYRVAIRKLPGRNLEKLNKRFNLDETVLSATDMIFDDVSAAGSEDENLDNRGTVISEFADTFSTSSESNVGDEDSETNHAPRDQMFREFLGTHSPEAIGKKGMKLNDIMKSRTSNGKMKLATILRSSSSYKKAKLIASQSQEENTESQPIDCVLETQPEFI